MSIAPFKNLKNHLQQGSRKKPLYKQLAREIKKLLIGEKLSPGERLPSSRALSNELGISRTTTLNAYEQLIAEGFLISHPQSGIYVTDGFKSVGATGESSDSGLIEACSSQNDPPLVFNAGPDISQFPFKEWARILGRVWRYPDQRILRNQMPGGYPGLRAAIADYLLKYRDIQCQQEQVIITAGSRDALTLLSTALLEQHNRVTLEDPCYPVIRNGFLSRDFTVQTAPLDNEGAIPQQSTSELVWLTPDRQYPTGVRMSVARRVQWLEQMCDQQNWIIEDDYDSEYRYEKAAVSSLYTLARQHLPTAQQRVILCGSFSKLLFNTVRIGYLVVPKHLIGHFEQLQQRLGIMAALPIQPALAEFIQDRKFNTHLRKMRRIYQQRRNHLHQLIQDKLSPYLYAELPDSGMHLVAHLSHSSPLKDTQLENLLLNKNIHAPALSRHYSAQGKQGLLLGFSGCDEVELNEGVEEIKQQLSIPPSSGCLSSYG